MAGKKIEQHRKSLVFGNIRVPLNHQTAWVAKISNKQYSIGSLWFFLHNPDKVADRNTYLKETRKFEIEMVTVTDRDEIADYFTGRTDTSESINEELRLKSLIESQSVEEKKQARKEVTREQYERPLCTKDSQLQASVSFKNVLQLVDAKGGDGPRPRSNPSRVKTLIDEIMSSSQLGDIKQKPIIVVPSSAIPGGINLQNAADLLGKGHYVDPTTLPLTKVQPVTIMRGTVGKHHEVQFEIYDNPLTFSRSKWQRVVGLFVTGTTYQLKDWPSSNDITKLFLKYRGFYIKYSDSPIEDNVKKWNVKSLNVHRTRRYLDNAVQNEFWKDLDEFMNKPRYR